MTERDDQVLAEGFARHAAQWATAAGAPAASVAAVAHAAAALSLAVSEGHVCLMLSALVDARDVAGWRAALLASRIVGTPDAPGALPLILDADGRLYLHRYFDYERRLARRLTQARRAGTDAAGAALHGPRAARAAGRAVRRQRGAPGRRRRLAAARRGARAARPAHGHQRRPRHRQDHHRRQPARLPARAGSRLPHRARRAHRQGRGAHDRGHPPAPRSTCPRHCAPRCRATRPPCTACWASRPGRFHTRRRQPAAHRRARGRRGLDAGPGAGHAAAGGRAARRRASSCWATRTSSPPSNRAPCSRS
jgi:hypothetical protein